MKSLILLLGLTACFGTATAQWYPLNSGTGENLHAIFFQDSLAGFCVGGGNTYAEAVPGATGTILKTNNSGGTWTLAYTDTLIALNSVVASGDTVQAFGADAFGNRVRLLSPDGGANWIKDTIPLVIVGAAYHDSVLYFIDYTNGGILKRGNAAGGVSVADSIYLYNVSNTGNIFCIRSSFSPGYNFDLLVSSDNGNSWDTMNVDAPIITHNSLSHASLWAFGDTVIFYATYPTAMAYSYDKGQNWSYFLPSNNAPAFGAYVITPDIVIGTKFPKYVMSSGDRGYNFHEQDTMPQPIAAYHFADLQTGFLCGNNGMIYKTTNAGGATGISNLSSGVDNMSVFPNPATDFLQLNCPAVQHITSISLSDMLGRCVRTFKSEERVLNINGMPQGHYILSVYTDRGTWMKTVCKK